MAYYSKYSGKEVDERLDRVNSIPTKISQLLNDKDYITEIELKAILDKISIVDFSKIPIDEDTIYWSENSDGKLVLKSKGGDGDSNWSVKKDSNGNKYIYTELPVVTQYGVTMYGNSGDINLPSLYAGLPIDNQTIYWDNGVLKSLGGGGGEGLDEEALRNYLLINGYATESWVLNLGYIGPEGLKNYVDISSNQDINGKKNFKSGISINGLDIYQSQDDVIYLDANLVVRGGITMFSDGEDVDIPSLAQGLPFDNRTIWYNPDTNQIEVIGGGSGGGGTADSVAWANITGKPTWIGSTKPSYSYSEITGAISTTELQNYLTQNSYLNVTSGDNRYLKLSGNASSATKLQTARTIWGQSFDGTGDVSGDISNLSTIVFDTSLGAPNIGYLWTNTRGMHMDMSGLGTEQQGTNLTLTPSGNVGIGTASPQQKLHVEGHIWANGDIAAKTKIHSFGNLIVNGNVGIGTENPSATFHAIGTIYKTCIFDSTYIAYGYNYGSIHLSLNGESKGVIGVNTVPSSKGSSNTAGTYIENVVSGEWMNFYNEGGVFLKANLLVNGGITMYSDQRKKTILNHVELSLKDIANAPLIEHYYNSDEKKTTHVGSIAQYWANMNDWFCKLDSEGYYTMEIQNAALASAISIARELDRYETKTDKAIKKLKKRICELEEEVERLKSA